MEQNKEQQPQRRDHVDHHQGNSHKAESYPLNFATGSPDPDDRGSTISDIPTTTLASVASAPGQTTMKLLKTLPNAAKRAALAIARTIRSSITAILTTAKRAALAPFNAMGRLFRMLRRGWERFIRALKKILKKIRLRTAVAMVAVVGAAFALGIVATQPWESDGPNGRETAGESQGDSSETGSEPDQAPSELDIEPTSADSEAGSSAPSNDSGPNTDSEANPDSNTGSTSTDPDSDSEADPEPTSESIVPELTPVFLVLDQEPPPYSRALEMAASLAPHVVYPSDCMSPLTRPDLMPNAPRVYRSGTHQGVDFLCFTPGRSAFAALDGQVVLVVNNYDDPTPQDRQRLLDIAAELDRTPPYTLLMLYGNYVVIDHGVFPDIGHVVSLYTHLESVDEGIRIGDRISAGQRVGEIGNRGTYAAANNDHDQDPHLHWELHIDDLYLGAGLNTEQTRWVYSALFSLADENAEAG